MGNHGYGPGYNFLSTGKGDGLRGDCQLSPGEHFLGKIHRSGDEENVDIMNYFRDVDAENLKLPEYTEGLTYWAPILNRQQLAVLPYEKADALWSQLSDGRVGIFDRVGAESRKR